MWTLKKFRDTTAGYLASEAPKKPVATEGEELARAGSLVVRLAQSPADLEAAQRLRYEVFTLEWVGHQPKPLHSNASYARLRRGLDEDVFDAYCEHLVAWDEAMGTAVGTYRILLPKQAQSLGCLYSDSEFWLDRIGHLRPNIVELGRSCIAPAYRRGAVIMLLWSALGKLLSSKTEARYLIGCASMPAADGGLAAASFYRSLAPQFLGDETLRVFPRNRLPIEQFKLIDGVQAAPLIKGYLRSGAKIIGEPHLDDEFGCVDFPMLLDLQSMQQRYRERFVADQA
jgi:putative hemolysin